MLKLSGLFALLFAVSISAFAQMVNLPNCGGFVSLYADSLSPSGYSLTVSGVQNCSNVALAGDDFTKVEQGTYKQFNLSRQSADTLRNNGLYLIVQSNSGKTSDTVYFKPVAPAGPRFLQTLKLGECGGKMELYKQPSGQLSLKFIGVTSCSNFIINQTQESYKITDGQGDYQTRNFTLSKEASRYYQLNLTLKSNSGKTRFDFTLTNP